MTDNVPVVVTAKPFWTSTAFWGSVASLIGYLLPIFKITVPPEDLSHLTDSLGTLITAALQFGGIVIAIWGRVRANAQLTLKTWSYTPKGGSK